MPWNVSGITIPGLQILGDSARRLMLHGWWQLHCILPTTQQTLFWTVTAQGRLDRERQSKDSESMHGFWSYVGFFAVVRSPSCSLTPRQTCMGSYIFSLSSNTTKFNHV